MKTSLLTRLAVVILFVVISWHCKPELPSVATEQRPVTKQLVHKTNPFSLSNLTMTVEKQKAGRLAGTGNLTVSNISSYPQYVYYRLIPDNITPEQFEAFKNSTGTKLMDFPFGNGAVYNDTTITETQIESLKDGNLYGISLITDTLLNKLRSSGNIQFQALDTIVLVPDTDTTTIASAMRHAGFDNARIGICLFKKPHGQVRYVETLDNGTTRQEPVRHTQVWALVYGIPLITETDDNGNYEIPYGFSFGTIMGVISSNNRVEIKPISTNSSGLGSVATAIWELLKGPNYIYGGVGSCAMKNNKDFVFSGHRKERFWSQILNAYYFHDLYCTQEGIAKAPPHMICYADWRTLTTGTTPAVGKASTPLLGHLDIGQVVKQILFSNIFHTSTDISVTFPNFYGILNKILPDMSLNVSTTEPVSYSSNFTQTAFHELSHASMLNQVGSSWYNRLIGGEVPGHSTTGNSYGDGNFNDAGIVALAESWAEYLGSNYARRRYPDNKMAGSQSGAFKLISEVLENDKYYGGLEWMPTGMFNDLNDATNSAESWDNISGVSIKQMYETFGPSIVDICGYKNLFAKRNPLISLWSVLDQYNPTCGSKFLSKAINGSYKRNDCPNPALATSVNVTIAAGTFYSTVSQAEADAQAEAYAQADANKRATCGCTTCAKGFKCINGNCTAGILVYTSSTISHGEYICVYHYEFPDGTNSINYTQHSTAYCGPE